MKSTLPACTCLLALLAGCGSGGGLSTSATVKANAILNGSWSGPGAYTFVSPPHVSPAPAASAAPAAPAASATTPATTAAAAAAAAAGSTGAPPAAGTATTTNSAGGVATATGAPPAAGTSTATNSAGGVATATGAPPTTSGASQVSASDPHLTYALNAINASRAQYGLPPVTLDVADCACALRHATDFANCSNLDPNQAGPCAHKDYIGGDLCNASNETQGVAGGQAEDQNFQTIHDGMMAEGPPPAGQQNHFSTITSASLTQVAIGEYLDANGTLWVSEEWR